MIASRCSSYDAVVVVSADAEWAALLDLVTPRKLERRPLGVFFVADLDNGRPVLFFHTGWGKIAAAAATAFVLESWGPRLLINLGTCGGFDG